MRMAQQQQRKADEMHKKAPVRLGTKYTFYVNTAKAWWESVTIE